MERIHIDADLPQKLKHLNAAVELVDAAGHVIAVVQPRLDPALYDILGSDIPDDELERRCQPGRKTYTAEEILAMLRNQA